MGYAPQSKENSNPQHQQQSTKATTPTFADERESATAISPLQAMMANSPQQQKLKSTAQLMANSPAQQRLNTTAQSFANKPESIQRMEDEELLQAKFESEPTQLEAAAEAPRPNNTGLPDNLKSGIENLSGMSMDHVKVHYNSDKPAQLQAHAYAQGSEIHVAPGQEQHLPHEAWHVVQQAQGRVRPTVQMKGNVPINDDVGLEAEADLMGGRALDVGHQVAQRAPYTSTNIQDAEVRKTKIFQFAGGFVVDTCKDYGNSAIIQRSEILQRIIVMADSQVDFGMIVNVYQMLVNGIDNRVTMLSILGRSDITDEQIGLQGHGNPSTYAGISAVALASMLTAAGVNDTNAVIDILACQTGDGGDLSYAAEFAKAMGNKSTVYANKGLGVVMPDGYGYSVENVSKIEMDDYTNIQAGCKTQITKATAIANDAKAALDKVVKSTSLGGVESEKIVKEIFESAGNKILVVAGDLFTKLYSFQAKLLATRQPLDDSVYVEPKK